MTDVLEERLSLGLVACLKNSLPPAYVVHELVEPSVPRENWVARYPNKKQLQTTRTTYK